MDEDAIKHKIEGGLPGCDVRVRGDGRHFEAVVICAAFAGKSLLEQHRMVYAALGDSMQGEIHALALRTYARDPGTAWP